jgi:TonB family protein
MTLKIKFLLTICFVFGLLLASPCRAWENEIPADMKGIALYMPDPDYPPQLYHRGIAGRGVFRITIDPKTGHVSEVKVLRSTGYVILNELAAKAFLQWRFKPGTNAHVTIPMDFHVSGYFKELH